MLLDQKHVNEEEHEAKTIGELRTELAANTNENIVIRRFARFQSGGVTDPAFGASCSSSREALLGDLPYGD